MFTSALMNHRHWRRTGRGKCVPTSDYYLKQAQVAASLALAESDPEKARALQVLALEWFDRAEKVKAEQARDKMR